MPELLLEVGCEELPASAVRRAVSELTDRVLEGLGETHLIEGRPEPRSACTPRRLIVAVEGVLETQPDRQEERRGPSVKAAYAEDGSPTKALQGFCRGVGLDPSEIETRDDYVWAIRTVKGLPAAEILAEKLPEAIQAVTFDKTMRWGKGRMRFARPIRWVVAVLGGEIIEFELEGVRSGKRSRGHRFLSPQEFEVEDFDSLMNGLRKRKVEPDPDKRVEIIRKESLKKANGKPLLDDELVEENAFLTEWPSAIRGEFRDEFLSLPPPVLITAMAKHERFFPIEDKEGRLANGFISITNGGGPETVKRGNEWVLNARFNDAKFFYDEDIRHTLEEFLDRTEGIVFQHKLGTIRQRADRIARLAKNIAEKAGCTPEEVEHCETAGRLCKADLSTGLVNELPSLQGIVGGEYAKRGGHPEGVWQAIASHYGPALSPKTGAERAALVVMCADESDRLAGFLGAGDRPKGSRDPYGLRRSAARLIDAQMGWNAEKAAIAEWIALAADGYGVQGVGLAPDDEIAEGLKEILEGRYEAMFPDIRYDAREAAWAARWDDGTSRFVARARALTKFAEDVSFVRTAKRPGNIVAAARKKGIVIEELNDPDSIDRSLFGYEEEGRLLEAAIKTRPVIEQLDRDQRFEDMVHELRGLAKPIDAFFDEVMVMTDDERLRDNRLRLLAYVDGLFRRIGDFDKIVIEGD
ncbi:MAG: glycine--tRNA ligase subunit beta [Armatimonadetes bacterium]|nr:glycine--tRNA ligase subunit beta [Armatimonadota bacterium]